MTERLSAWRGSGAAGAVLVTLFLFLCSGSAWATDIMASKVAGPNGYDSLVSRAEEKGKVKILARVNVPYETEKKLSGSAVAAQRAAIRTAQDHLTSSLARKGLNPDHTHKYTYVPYLAMTVDRATLDTLLASDGIVQVMEDLPVPVSGTPPWDVALIGAAVLHNAGITGSGMTVAILDTGVDKTHPYLSGAVISEACYSSTGSDANGTWTSLCPSGVLASTAPGSAMPYVNNCPAGACDHGTHVTGTVAGRDNVSGSPGPGVAPIASIIAIQVFSRFDSAVDCGGTSLTPCALTYSSDQVKGLERVYDLRGTYTIASVNMSVGGGRYSDVATCDANNAATKAAIDNLRAAGIATVIASGNEGYCGSMGAPGCISTAVSVGATTNADAVASYSNSASFLSLLAPGSSITSSIPANAYAAWDGTSMATPHVAGSWALLKSKNTSATVDQILAAFTGTGVSVTDTKCGTVTKKRINVNEAYGALSGGFALTVTTTGDGTGEVTSSPSGIVCGSSCSATYGTGVQVTLTATPSSGASTFAGWGGACSGSADTCMVTMDASKSVTASFIIGKVLTVSTKGTGTGSVQSKPAAISCPSVCLAGFNDGAGVTLTAIRGLGSTFAYWGGACSATAPGYPSCDLVMSENMAASAHFFPTNSRKYMLATAKRRPSGGDGTITSNDGAIDCGATCSKAYYPGTPVTLVATASGDAVFTGWTGACAGTDPCALTINRGTSVAATFLGPQRLTVSKRKINRGDGTVTSDPAGIDCGNTCRSSFIANTEVVLTATPSSEDVIFAGWSGACSGSGTTCTLTMDKAKTAIPVFVGPYNLRVVKAGRRGGAGTVTSDVPGIDCGETCQYAFPYNTTVTLLAEPDANSTFTGWSGAGCIGTDTCVVTMGAARTVRANFTGP